MNIYRIVRLISVAVFGLGLTLTAIAQPLGVLQSAETMDRGAIKLMVAPIMTFGKDGGDDKIGVTARAGYGFIDRLDLEAKLGFFDGATVVGVDGEYWIFRGSSENSGVDFSLTGGIHWKFGSNNSYDVFGIEVIPQISGNLTKNLELCGAFSASFESIQDLPAGYDDSYTTLHLVPGIEYRLSKSLDLVGEFGLALNNDSFNYIGAGLAYYLN